jgi:hypothetical protein
MEPLPKNPSKQKLFLNAIFGTVLGCIFKSKKTQEESISIKNVHKE